MNLRQWGILWATYTAENAGRLLDQPPEVGDGWGAWGWWGWGWGWWGPEALESREYQTIKDIVCCPMATKPANPTGEGSLVGGAFLAWGWGESPYDSSPFQRGSYAVNGWVGPRGRGDPELRKLAWSSADIPNAVIVPVLLDSASPVTGLHTPGSETLPPPECDAVPTLPSSGYMTPCCINRHDAYINGLFLDWSVRKVGLKELWTLKWNKGYDTRGPWTKAGGVQPEDWPQWMRRFRD
jgi:hypothetical protein